MTYRQTADFLLFDWLEVESLAARPRFADHSRETFVSVMDTCEKIARDKYAPFNRVADTEEPWFDGEQVHLPEAIHASAKAYAMLTPSSGFCCTPFTNVGSGMPAAFATASTPPDSRSRAVAAQRAVPYRGAAPSPACQSR